MKVTAVSIFLSVILAGFPSQALNKGFYRHERVQKQRKEKRERGANRLRAIREKQTKKKERQAKSFEKVRKRWVKDQAKRKTYLKKEIQKKEAAELKKASRANRYARSRRRKNYGTWQEQNREYGIPMPEDRPIKNKHKKDN